MVDLSDLGTAFTAIDHFGTATDSEIAAISIDDTTNEPVFQLVMVILVNLNGARHTIQMRLFMVERDDNIVGGDSDQTFITFSGADSIDGSGGSDTLIINGNSSDYSFGLRRGVFHC